MFAGIALEVFSRISIQTLVPWIPIDIPFEFFLKISPRTLQGISQTNSAGISTAIAL